MTVTNGETRAAFRIRGVVEGFYGRPWSHAERLRMIEFCGANRLNTFFYAPKDDPYHRDEWRVAYPADRLAELAELVDACRRHAVDFIFSVSPGNTVCFSGDDDFALLCAKMDAVFAHGVRRFALLYDDIDPRLAHEQDRGRFADSAAAQAFLANRLLAYLRSRDQACSLIVCPTEYCEGDPSPYRAGLATHLDRDILVIWTGIGIIAPTISGAEADRIAGYFGHELLLWDNYPVNDYAPDSLFLGPLRGRDPHLAEHSHAGVVSNPMNQAEASKVALLTYADYLWDPLTYDADASWRSACRRLAGDAAFDAFWHFCRYTESTRLWENETPLKPLADEFWREFTSSGGVDAAAWRADVHPARAALVAELEAVREIPGELKRTLSATNPHLLADIEPWFAKLRSQAELTLAALRLLVDARSAGPDRPGEEQAEALWQQRIDVERAREALKADSHLIGGTAFSDLIDRALASLPAELQFAPHADVRATTDFPCVPTPDVTGISNMTADPAHPLAAMVDSDDATWFSGTHPGAGGTRVGDYVGVDLGAVYPVSRIHVSFSSPSRDGANHYWRQVAVEVSVNGETWELLLGCPGRRELNIGWDRRPLRFVRVISTLDQDDPVAVRAFRVDAGSPEVPYSRSAFAAGKVADGDRQTYFLSAAPVSGGQSMTLDLGSAMPVRGVALVQDGTLHLGSTAIEASTDGLTWTEIGQVETAAELVPWRGQARYLRARSREGSATPVKIYHFSARPDRS